MTMEDVAVDRHDKQTSKVFLLDGHLTSENHYGGECYEEAASHKIQLNW
jgi:hypothetical protein